MRHLFAEGAHYVRTLILRPILRGHLRGHLLISPLFAGTAPKSLTLPFAFKTFLHVIQMRSCKAALSFFVSK